MSLPLRFHLRINFNQTFVVVLWTIFLNEKVAVCPIAVHLKRHVKRTPLQLLDRLIVVHIGAAIVNAAVVTHRHVVLSVKPHIFLAL
jgi:hypothetical protein